MKSSNEGRSIIRSSLAIALVATVASLLLVACTGSEAGPVPVGPSGEPQPTAAGSGPAGTPSPTPLPRRTPAPSGTGDDTSPGLIFALVTVNIVEGSLTIDGTKYAVEELYFTVNNQGEEEHGVVVVRWDGDPAGLPVDPVSRRVVANSQIAGSLEPLGGGNTEIFEIEPIAPGKYVIFCNEPGHYQRGEYAGFEVIAPR